MYLILSDSVACFCLGLNYFFSDTKRKAASIKKLAIEKPNLEKLQDELDDISK